MTGPPEPDPSVWAATYEAEIQSLLRAIKLSDGFVLHPIELPGPWAARALAARLDAQGHPVVVIDPPNADTWNDLVDALFLVTPQRGGVVMVIGASDESPGERAGLRLVNQRRDVLARHIGVPLLWCGSKSFLDLTWRQAPDFWSVADVPRRLGVSPATVLPSERADAHRTRDMLVTAAARRWLLVTSPESFASCMRHQVWGRQHEREIHMYSPGDVFFMHVTGGRGLAAMGVFAGEPFYDPTPLWGADPRGTFPWRMRFAPLGVLRQGIPTKDTLAPLRKGAPRHWFHGFIQQSHQLTDQDFDHLRRAFEAALLEE
jgi:hypothetical protein